MNNYGYIKVAASIPSVKVGDCNYNVSEIEKMIVRVDMGRQQVVLLPRRIGLGGKQTQPGHEPLLHPFKIEITVPIEI